MRKILLIPALMFFTLSSALVIYCQTQTRLGEEKISSGYAKIFCESGETLRVFNKRIKLGFLSALLKARTGSDLSVEGQLAEKIDVIVERVERILEMRPRNFTISLYVLPDADKIRALYKKKYYREVDFIAFYAPGEKAIYIAADEAKSVILAHEIAHAVIDQFFGVAAPVKIHELLAQYVEENFEE
jgi:hypothetical protein